MEGDRKKVYTDEEVFAQIKDKSRQVYMKSSKEFKMFNIGHDFKEDNMDTVISEMEEDEDMFQEAGIPFPTQTDFKDKATGQQGVVEARQTICRYFVL